MTSHKLELPEDVLLFDLDLGEAEAIALAVEYRAELVILDEVAGRYAPEAQDYYLRAQWDAW